MLISRAEKSPQQWLVTPAVCQANIKFTLIQIEERPKNAGIVLALAAKNFLCGFMKQRTIKFISLNIYYVNKGK